MTKRLLKVFKNNGLMAKWTMVLLAAFCLLWSMQLFIAGNAYYSVKNDIEAWQITPNKASVQKINSGLGKIGNAIDYFPNNALYYQIQGQLFEWKAVVEKRGKESGDAELGLKSSSANLKNAAQSYEKSLLLRPKWSGSWIGLASVKLQPGELDDEFYHYWYLGTETSVSNEELADALDKSLQEANKNYGVARSKALKGVFVNTVNPEIFYEWSGANKKQGGQVKMEKVMNEEKFAEWEEFVKEHTS